VKILDSGILRPSDLYLEPGEKPVLWFSLAPFWEPTASKAVEDKTSASGFRRLSMEETAYLGRVFIASDSPSSGWSAGPTSASAPGLAPRCAMR